MCGALSQLFLKIVADSNPGGIVQPVTSSGYTKMGETPAGGRDETSADSHNKKKHTKKNSYNEPAAPADGQVEMLSVEA